MNNYGRPEIAEKVGRTNKKITQDIIEETAARFAALGHVFEIRGGRNGCVRCEDVGGNNISKWEA